MYQYLFTQNILPNQKKTLQLRQQFVPQVSFRLRYSFLRAYSTPSENSKTNVSNFYLFLRLEQYFPHHTILHRKLCLPIMYQWLLLQHRLLRLPHLIHNCFHFCHILFINIPSAVNSLRNLIQIPTDLASLMDSAGANDVCIKLIMGHSMKNDTTKRTYTHKT